MSLPALLGGSPRTLGVVSDIPNLLARLSPDGVHRSASKVLPLAKEAESAPVQNSADAILMGSQFWQRCLLDWACDIPSALSGLRTWCLFRRLLVSHRNLVLAVIFMWPGCRGASHVMLRDVADSSEVAKYLDISVPECWRGSPRTSLATCCEASDWAPGLATQNSSVLPVVSPARLVPGRRASGRLVLPLSRLSHLLFLRSALSLLVLGHATGFCVKSPVLFFLSPRCF